MPSSAKQGLKLPLSGTRLRLFLVVFAVSGAAATFSTAYLCNTWIQSIQGEFDVELYNIAVDVRDSIERGEPPETTRLTRKILPFDPGDAGFQFTDLRAGRIIRWPAAFAEEASLVPTTEEWSRFTRGSAVFHSWERPSRHGKPRLYRVVEVGVDVPNDGLPGISAALQVAAPYERVEGMEKKIWRNAWLSTGLVLLFILIGSYALARISLRPLEELIQNASRLKPGNLNARIPLPRGDEGLRRLAATLNALLDEITRATESQERFVREASHQLKTPIAILTTEAEMISRASETGPEARKLAESVGQQARYLGRLVHGLLVLARVTRGEEAFVRSRLSVPEILFELLRMMEPLAKERGIHFRLNTSEGESFETEGDEALLRSLFETLLDNAIQYSPAGSMVSLSLEADSSDASRFLVRIEDQGPGIPDDLQEKVFERFFKGNSKSKGFGLGLSIAREIAAAHEAKITLEKAMPHGVRVLISLKKASA